MSRKIVPNQKGVLDVVSRIHEITDKAKRSCLIKEAKGEEFDHFLQIVQERGENSAMASMNEKERSQKDLKIGPVIEKGGNRTKARRTYK